jgi:ribonuclease-3
MPIHPESRLNNLERFQEGLGLCFKDISLLDRALTHKSYVNEGLGGGENEKLEFLGDSVLGLVVSEYVFLNYPDYREGRLSKLKSVIVSEPTLARKAQEIKLGSYLQLGKGEMMAGGSQKPSILADALEALVGAIYLDGGLQSARSFVARLLADEIRSVDKEDDMDYKTILQELSQGSYGTIPTYRVVRKVGPDHERIFEVEVLLREEVRGTGIGTSKKSAEQEAARMALDVLRGVAV